MFNYLTYISTKKIANFLFSYVFLILVSCNVSQKIYHRKSNLCFIKGVNLSNNKKYDSAILFLNQALKYDTMNGSIYQYRGYCHFKLNQLNDAISDLELANKRGAHTYSTNLYLGKAYFKLEKYDQAIIYFFTARAFSPNDTTINYLLALCCFKENDTLCTSVMSM